MSIRKGTAAISLSVALALSAAACTSGNPNAATDANRASRNMQVRTQQTVPEPNRNLGNNAVAERLERLAESVPEVKGANCVVFGDTAIVGIDVNAKLDRSRVGTVKYSVAEALKKDPYGVNALVTADIDLYQRLQEIGADIRRGRPLSGFAEELADIVGRIIPQMPRDVIERETAPPPRPQATTQERGERKAAPNAKGNLDKSE